MPFHNYLENANMNSNTIKWNKTAVNSSEISLKEVLHKKSQNFKIMIPLFIF